MFTSCQKSSKKVLYIFNWTDYISKDLITEFEKKYECQVVYDTYNSNENMFTKVMHNNASYDIVFPTTDYVVVMKNKGMLEKLDKSKLPHYGNLDKTILDKGVTYDPNNEYSIPYFWGTTGLIYNKTKIPDSKMKDVSWNILADKSFYKKNVVTLLDDSRSVVGSALIYSGYKINDISEESIAKARTALLEWDKNVSQYDSDSFKNEIQDGTSWLAQAYSGDAMQIIAQNHNIGFALPKEGVELWIDSFVILKNAENKELAYKFIDFLLEAQNAKKNAEFVQYATPNKAAFDLLSADIKNNPIVYPPKEYLDKCDVLGYIGDKVNLVNKLWEEVRNN
jgi:spermidine/putrescine transport system substrate-binding protein